ncbi:MAG: hypothetical protein WDN45_17770 [Caulobacteraceae bacterium]
MAFAAGQAHAQKVIAKDGHELPDWSGVWQMVGNTVFDQATKSPPNGVAGPAQHHRGDPLQARVAQDVRGQHGQGGHRPLPRPGDHLRHALRLAARPQHPRHQRIHRAARAELDRDRERPERGCASTPTGVRTCRRTTSGPPIRATASGIGRATPWCSTPSG